MTVLPPRVLVVDDLADNRNLLMQLLDADFRVTIAENGAEAIASIERERPDLMLLDLMMPVLDGFAVLAHLQAQPAPFLPVIVVTAATERPARLAALRAGAHEFLDKPVDAEELLVRIATLLDLKRSREEVEIAMQMAESAARHRSLFLATMSHEIRTPLAAIIGYAQTLLQSAGDLASLAEIQRIILHHGRHLQRVIDDVLDLSKIESAGGTIEHLDVEIFPLFGDIQRVASEHASQKGIAFAIDYEFPLPTTITSDPTRLAQIVLNLCGNAIKFTEHGEVRLRVACDRDRDQLCVSVIDSGIGMTAEQMALVFEPYVQADASTSRRFGGTGLGLFISARLARELGGSLAVSSVVNRGSRFELEVATGTLAAAVFVEEFTETTGIQRLERFENAPSLSGRILVAEDHDDLRHLIVHLAGLTGATVVAVIDGEQAVEAAMANDFDLILMDMNMPVIDGLAAATWLRRAGVERPIIALSAGVMAEDVESYMRAGCTGFLAKPIDVSRFYDTLQHYVGAATRTAVGDTTEWDDLVHAFRSGLPQALADMESAASLADYKGLRALAHRMKGTAGSFGFPQLGEASGRIEDDLATGNFAAAIKAARRLSLHVKGML